MTSIGLYPSKWQDILNKALTKEDKAEITRLDKRFEAIGKRRVSYQLKADNLGQEQLEINKQVNKIETDAVEKFRNNCKHTNITEKRRWKDGCDYNPRYIYWNECVECGKEIR